MKNKKLSMLSRAKSWLAGYWYIPLIIIVISGFFIKKKKKVEHPDEDKSNQASRIMTKKGVSVQKATDYSLIASQVAHHLGTAYSVFDPRSWTENDKDVYDLLKDVIKQDFKYISLLYFEVYAKGRTLSTDLAKLLDKELYNKLKVK